MQTFILCGLYGFVRRQILIINNGCLSVYRHSKNLYTKPAVIKLLIYTKLHKKPNTHRLTKMPSITRGHQYLLYRSRMTAVSTKICIMFFKKKQIKKIMLKNKSEVLANYHKSSLVLKSIIQFPRKKANKTCKSVFVSKIICYLVTLEHSVGPSHQWLTEFIIITCHSLTS